jgi:hypothetical protein
VHSTGRPGSTGDSEPAPRESVRGGEASVMPHPKADATHICEESVGESMPRTKAPTSLLPG